MYAKQVLHRPCSVLGLHTLFFVPCLLFLRVIPPLLQQHRAVLTLHPSVPATCAPLSPASNPRHPVTPPSHSLLDEVRILLVHGVLHLAGFDHEEGGDQAATMAAEEAAIMSEMGWKGEGLISAAATAAAASEGGWGLCWQGFGWRGEGLMYLPLQPLLPF